MSVYEDGSEPILDLEWQATHKHVKTQKEYMLVGWGKKEDDLACYAIYMDAGYNVWLRPASEFNEVSRFEDYADVGDPFEYEESLREDEDDD